MPWWAGGQIRSLPLGGVAGRDDHVEHACVAILEHESVSRLFVDGHGGRDPEDHRGHHSGRAQVPATGAKEQEKDRKREALRHWIGSVGPCRLLAINMLGQKNGDPKSKLQCAKRSPRQAAHVRLWALAIRLGKGDSPRD